MWVILLIMCSLGMIPVNAQSTQDSNSHLLDSVKSKEDSSVPLMTYVGDIESPPSASQGSRLKVVYCFSYVGTDEYSKKICPSQSFSGYFTGIILTLPEDLKWVSVFGFGTSNNYLANPASGFICNPDSVFNIQLSADMHSIKMSGFTCRLDESVPESVFALGGYATSVSRVHDIKVTKLTSRILIGRDSKEVPTSSNFYIGGISWATQFPFGIPCLAIVPPGMKHCWIQ